MQMQARSTYVIFWNDRTNNAFGSHQKSIERNVKEKQRDARFARCWSLLVEHRGTVFRKILEGEKMQTSSSPLQVREPIANIDLQHNPLNMVLHKQEDMPT